MVMSRDAKKREFTDFIREISDLITRWSLFSDTNSGF